MNIKISDYITDSIDDGPGIRLTFNCNEEGYEVDFKKFRDLINDSIQFDNIGGITFNDVYSLEEDSPFYPYIKFASSIRLDIRVTSNIDYEQAKDKVIMKYIDIYNDGREIDVKESRKQNKLIRIG